MIQLRVDQEILYGQNRSRTGLARASIHTNVPLYTQKKMNATKSKLIITRVTKNTVTLRANDYLSKLNADQLKILDELDRKPSK